MAFYDNIRDNFFGPWLTVVLPLSISYFIDPNASAESIFFIYFITGILFVVAGTILLKVGFIRCRWFILDGLFTIIFGFFHAFIFIKLSLVTKRIIRRVLLMAVLVLSALYLLIKKRVISLKS